MFKLAVKTDFSAAHFLPNYNGQCANMHGHTWDVIAEWHFADPDYASGMCADFKELKQLLNRVCDTFDHHTINETLMIPSAELIARYIFETVNMTTLVASTEGHLHSVTVYESRDAWVTYDEMAYIRSRD